MICTCYFSAIAVTAGVHKAHACLLWAPGTILAPATCALLIFVPAISSRRPSNIRQNPHEGPATSLFVCLAPQSPIRPCFLSPLLMRMLPFAIGSDVCHIPRIYKILSAKHGSRFIHKILTQQETRQTRAQGILQCLLSGNTPQKSTVSSLPDQDDRLRRAAEYMAGR